jgi:hypothetical protein
VIEMVKNVLENNTNVFVEKKIAYMEKKKVNGDSVLMQLQSNRRFEYEEDINKLVCMFL